MSVQRKPLRTSSAGDALLAESQTRKLQDAASTSTRQPTSGSTDIAIIKETSDLSLQASSTCAAPPNASNESEGDRLVQSPSSLSSTARSPTAERSRMKTAFEDASHFTGGLIRHPHVSTKHYSILRHSHGVVYYQGPSTSIAVTIFSDEELPPDRRLWLQMKGWSGKAGMTAKALLRTNSSWINVTPSLKVDASELPLSDERAWQRDIRKFLDKAPKEARQHHIRETAVIRIPFMAQDGYFRLVLTSATDRVLLCPSPVFRIASTSLSASSIKGASLSTLPIEVGVKLLSTTAVTVAGNAVAPLANTVRKQVSQLMPSSPTSVPGVATTAYNVSGADDKIENVNQIFEDTRDLPMSPSDSAAPEHLLRPDIMGDPAGPEPPFPVRIDGKVVRGSGRSTTEIGMPTANLHVIPGDLGTRLSGIYFGWASVSYSSKADGDISNGWQKAVISVSPSPYTNPTIAPKDIIRTYLIHDFEGQQFLDKKIASLVMGYLRRFPGREAYLPENRESLLFETYKDILIAQASLDREEWQPEISLELIKSAKSSRSVKERYVDVRRKGQNQVDRMPIHKAGVRMTSHAYRDKLIGNGGMYVLR